MSFMDRKQRHFKQNTKLCRFMRMFTKCNEERSRLCSGIIAVLHLITPFRNDQMQRARGNFQRKNPLYSSLCSYQFSPIRSRCSKMLSECTVEDEKRRGKFIRRPAKVHYAISPQGANLHRRSRNSRPVRRGLPTRTLQRRRTWLACRVPPPLREPNLCPTWSRETRMPLGSLGTRSRGLLCQGGVPSRAIETLCGPPAC